MPQYRVKLNKREAVAEGTLAFHFDKPTGFAYKAGQFLELTLVDPPETDAKGDSRAFSIASAPSEPHLMVATRMRDTAFKRVMRELPLGAEVQIDGPFGNLILHNNTARPAVFVAGGIGITPFRSIVFRAARERLPHRLFLFYSNRRPEDAAFLGELQALRAENPNYSLVDTMTGMERGADSRRAETDRISKEMLLRHLGDLNGPIYYIAGPPAMVGAMQQLLNSAGVNDDDIRSEEFAGY
ncbi:MAG TPA: FAD-dependent oxidoreductase [Paludibaculum sp.]